ncbi:acyl-coenzyme A oxidase [Sarracenia purpurea var. burkii]
MLGRKELFTNTRRKAVHAFRRIAELRLSEEEAAKLRYYIDEPCFTDLHWGMFVPAIKGQGTEEQQQKWLPLAYKMQIIGCYAQTELGHGSNVQGLETTATFDRQTDEFIIHSPTLTSIKGGYVDCCHGVWRIRGSLAVSRGIGDGHLKQWVTAKLETKILKIKPNFEFLILASDGLWDKVMHSKLHFFENLSLLFSCLFLQ